MIRTLLISRGYQGWNMCFTGIWENFSLSKIMVSNGINGVKLSIFRFKIGNIHNIALNITKWDFLKSARCTRCVYRANNSSHWVPSLLKQIIATQGVVYLKPISWTAKIHINTLLIIHLLLFKFHLSIHSFSPLIQVFFPFLIFLFWFCCTRRKVPWYSTFFITVKLSTIWNQVNSL